MRENVVNDIASFLVPPENLNDPAPGSIKNDVNKKQLTFKPLMTLKHQQED